MQLWRLRAEKNLDQKPFANLVGISRSTLARIEAAERAGRKYPMDLRTIMHMREEIKKTFDLEVGERDFEGVTIAPPRPGRPKKNKNGAEV